MHIRVFQQEFSDLRTTQAAVIGLRLGLDPAVSNEIGTNDSLYNHPPVLLYIAQVLRFHLEWAFLTFCIVSIALYTFFSWLWLRHNPSLTLLLASLSGAALLPIERLNNDMHIYMLLISAILLPGRIRRPVFIGLAAILKIFPAVAMLALVPWRANWRDWPKLLMPTLAIAVVPFLLYFIWDWDHILRAIALTERGAASAYGVWVNHFLVEERVMALPYGQELQYGFYLVLAVLLIRRHATIADWAGLPKAGPSPGMSQSEFAFFIGASIYVFTYLISANWDYRMIFCLLALPYFLALPNRFIVVAFQVILILGLNYYILVGLLGNLGGAINIAAKLGLHMMMFAALIVVPLNMQAQARLAD